MVGLTRPRQQRRPFSWTYAQEVAGRIQARELMERQSERLDDYPELKAKVAAHLQETNQQLKRLEQCLEACGESTSSVKDTAQSVAANTMAMAHSMAGDEIFEEYLCEQCVRALLDQPPISRC